jgi:uncharacterized membrane protein
VPELLDSILYPLTRWVHIVCTTLIVGGTLFYELVLPIAMEDLRNEQRLYAFARARLVFRWVVWLSVVGLLVSGSLTMLRMWNTYYHDVTLTYVGRWALSHMAIGFLAIIIALLLTIGSRPPENPVRWMRLNLVVLAVVIFLGSASGFFRFALQNRQQEGQGQVPPPTTTTTLPVEQ